MRDKIDRLEVFVNSIKDARSQPVSTENGGTNEDATAGPLIGSLRLSETGGTEYVGPGHWESVIEDVGRRRHRYVTS
jgi:hypothetical protein